MVLGTEGLLRAAVQQGTIQSLGTAKVQQSPKFSEPADSNFS